YTASPPVRQPQSGDASDVSVAVRIRLQTWLGRIIRPVAATSLLMAFNIRPKTDAVAQRPPHPA
ncbi:MAG: hypothetical protein ACYC42_12025, partial [Lysobacter sp.]